MSLQTNSLGRSPLSADLPVETGNPLFSGTPRRSVESRLERMILDDLRTATGVAVAEGAPFTALWAVAADHGLNVVEVIERAEARLAAEAVQR